VGLRDHAAELSLPPMTALSSTSSGGLAATAAALGRRLLLSDFFVLYLSLAYIAVLAPFVPHLVSADNLQAILTNMWPLLIVAIGQTFVLIGAGIDLSQTAVMGLVSVIGAALISQGVQPDVFAKAPIFGVLVDEHGGLLAGVAGGMLLAIVVMVAIGAFVGTLNGTAITRLQMPAFMVTLVTLTFFAAVAIWLTKSERVGGVPLSYLDISELSLAGLALGPLQVTWAFLIALGVAVLGHLLLAKTVFGRRLYAVGANRATALVSGVPVAATLTWTYVISGACAALGGLLYSSQLGIGQPSFDSNILLDIVGATVIGGTSLYGGKGKIVWTVFGVFFYTLLANTLDLLDLAFYTVTIVKGAVILGAVVLDTLRRRLAGAATVRAPEQAVAAGAAS
jgi:ribose/xylose/arabinose/galactoside ABC-type transport system permease subunit